LFYVYHISDSDNLSLGYIGVTKNLQHRWNMHLKSDYTVGNTIREKNWTFEKNMKIIFCGDEKQCYDLEIFLRPEPYIGLNESAGGCGGDKYSFLTDDKKISRNKKISEKLKNREHTWGEKVSKTRIEREVSVGEKNGRAKKWKLIDPTGNEYFLHGTLETFCKEKNLSKGILLRYKNKKVPEFLRGTCGGYRPLCKEHEVRRDNTTDWSLILLEN